MKEQLYYVFGHHSTKQVWEWIRQRIPIIHLSSHCIEIHRHRLIVFMEKGTTCLGCKRTAALFRSEVGIKSKELSNWYWNPATFKPPLTHLNLYGEDLSFMMTVDHRIPHSLGGEDTLDNYEPLCEKCNRLKGNDPDWLDDLPMDKEGNLVHRPSRQVVSPPGTGRRRKRFYYR